MRSITHRQQQVLDYIRRHLSVRGYPPTVREIGEYFDISSRGAYDHVKALEKKEYIRCDNKRSRAIELVDRTGSGDELLTLPILGRVAAGTPLLAAENLEGTVSVPRDSLGSGDHFALRVKGDSMVNAGIIDGDLVLVRKQETAENGQIVVAMLDEAVTLKRIYREQNRIRLQSENPAFPAIFTRDVRVVGKLVKLIRDYR